MRSLIDEAVFDRDEAAADWVLDQSRSQSRSISHGRRLGPRSVTVAVTVDQSR
jgi:hypothetical protein